MTHDAAAIAAYVDGELDDISAARIAREAESDPALAAEIARQRALKASLAAHYAPVLDEPLPDRLTAMLAGAEKIDTSLAARREARRAGFGTMQWGAIAAALVLGIGVGMRPWVPSGPVAVESGALVASGPLAAALDSQLASNQPAGAPVRIGVSFRAADGRACRSFESAGIDGIGCRNGGRWELQRTLRGKAAGEYRQAASGELAAAAAAMMAGDPMDADAERAARDAGWGR